MSSTLLLPLKTAHPPPPPPPQPRPQQRERQARLAESLVFAFEEKK